MSFAHYFRVKAEFYGMLLSSSHNAVDRTWNDGLVRSYNLLAASEDRHYHSGLKAVPSNTEAVPGHQDAPTLEARSLSFCTPRPTGGLQPRTS